MKTLKIYSSLLTVVVIGFSIWIYYLKKELKDTEEVLVQCSERYYQEIGKQEWKKNCHLWYTLLSPDEQCDLVFIKGEFINFSIKNNVNFIFYKLFGFMILLRIRS